MVLADILYKNEEDKTKLIGGMTVKEFEERIRRLSPQAIRFCVIFGS